MKDVRRCTRCIMDDSADSSITFNSKGECNYCTDAIQSRPKVYFPNQEGEHKLKNMISTLKDRGRSSEYDCLMGLSGGLDSSYLAYLGAAKWGLRIAAVHVNDGYDTEISTANIERLCRQAGIDLITIEPDKEQYNALTKAYLYAGVPNLAIPQDNILFAALYKFARKQKLPYFLSGANFALECIFQRANTHSAYDLVNIKDINKRFGSAGIDKLPLTSEWARRIDEKFLGMHTLTPLNHIEYNRDRALKELNSFCGFEYYGKKHLENYLTAFVQLRWFPEKFGVDKRKWHLSSMIVSNQMSREAALAELKEPLYSPKYINHVNELICKNLELSSDELEALVNSPGHQHDEYKIDRIAHFYRQAHNRIRYLKNGERAG